MLSRSLIISIILCATATLAHSQTVQLITAAEAKLPNATSHGASRAITRGPGIKVVSPDPAMKSIRTPFDFKIVFEPRGGAKIDPSSATITYLKNPAVDLTERLKSGIRPDGLHIHGATAPAGEHQIRISVKDNDGRQTSEVFSLNVVD